MSTQYNFSLWNIWVASTLLKILLFPAYYSTDFDVHRNWLSITKLLPLNRWYLENTSEWTLDYPPFFAYFEWFLSLFVPTSVSQDGCISLVAKGEFGMPTVIFQRSTVIVSEIVLFISLQYFVSKSSNLKEKKRNFVVASSIALSPGFFMVDHIHFQYNGFLMGILVLSIVNAKLGNYLQCGFWFAVLLCFKHIFLYIAPSYFVYLLSAYCLDWQARFPTTVSDTFNFVKWKNLFKLASVVLGVFAVAFGPFIYYGQLYIVLQRLFPFSRGLTHAYWAPNIWAIYSLIDRVLIQVALRVPGSAPILSLIFKQLDLERLKTANTLTRGLVGDVEFFVLPNIQPNHTFLLTLFYQSLSLVPLFLNPTFERFIGSMTLCAWASFLFGWHVHEKAIMLIIVPFTFLIPRDRKLLPLYETLTASGYVSLFPLLFGSAEWLFKALLTFVWFVIFSNSFNEVCDFSSTMSRRVFILDRLNFFYIVGLIPLSCVIQLLDIQSRNFEVLRRFEFLRLMAYSTYCAIGVISSWNMFSWLYFLDDSLWEGREAKQKAL
ncbi:uncharacterized protein OGAPODRAFT_97123 [Ogataea polymorpha]|uniref:uncharacterized protein n=1 Tax=Ogataea polymorpha TaxID=460523 RepID=UPI0007F3F74E|nr:uncharacterized protein OGAPODRAFT_97123 [Ogataea polymorpha]KAG7934040.1 hypothetical protein KL934_002962 [Ogataea polymorpha]OBA18719.1 hypothetical protein OGAPODRAFT_97123 [Ogataea polymorpha]